MMLIPNECLGRYFEQAICNEFVCVYVVHVIAFHK